MKTTRRGTGLRVKLTRTEDGEDLRLAREASDARDRFQKMLDNLRAECGIEFVSLRREIARTARASSEAALSVMADRLVKAAAERDALIAAQNETLRKRHGEILELRTELRKMALEMVEVRKSVDQPRVSTVEVRRA